MCEHCRNIQTWRKFDAPKDYLACIAYIQQLVGQLQIKLSTLLCLYIQNRLSLTESMLLHVRPHRTTRTYA